MSRTWTFYHLCQSMRQQTLNGKSCVGGELSDRRGGRQKGTSGRRGKNLPSSAVMQMLVPRELRMLLTGDNEEPGWVPDTWSFAFYRCIGVSPLGFFFFFYSVFLMQVCETGKARVCSAPLPPHERKDAAHKRFGISRISLGRHFWSTTGWWMPEGYIFHEKQSQWEKESLLIME